MTLETVLTITLAIACVALGVGVGTFIGLILHIIFGGDDFTAMHAYITDIDKEKTDLQLENNSLHCKIIGLESRLSTLHQAYATKVCSAMEYKFINDKLSEENTALKLKINEMEESLRTTLDHNAYLSKEARRLNERNIELNSRQKEALKYLKDGLASRISSLENSNLALEIGACGAYRRVRDEIEYLEKKYESEDKNGRTDL